MVKQLLVAALVVLTATGTASAQRGGGGRAGGSYGGARGGYGGYGGFGQHGYGGYGYGYGRGFYGAGGFYGGWGWGYPYFGWDAFGYGYPYYGGSGGLAPAVAAVGGAMLPSAYMPPTTNPLDPTAIPALPPPLPPPPAAQSPAAAASATVNVVVPNGAQVWFDETLSPAKDGKWSYTTSKLEPGKTYVLKVKARWEQNGQDQNYEIPLRVVAGDNMTLDLTRIR